MGIYDRYEKWISIQNSSIDTDMINIAIAHGMIANSTVHPNFLTANYDYIALGDDHKMHKVSDHAWYSGSTGLWNFDELSDQKGYLIVDVEHNKAYPK